MPFELTDALTDQVLFCMEDQNEAYAVDAETGLVVKTGADGEDFEDSGVDPERLVPLPSWTSTDGFRLMEAFAASLRNPLAREDLTAALDRGRGVFRAFKDALSSRPEIEKLWFAFKEKEMRRAVRDWYDGLREAWGLERLGEEPEETLDLVLEDFRFRPAEDKDDSAALELHGLCLEEAYAPRTPGAEVPPQDLVGAARAAPWPLPRPGDGRGRAVVAETSRGDFAGFAFALREGTVVRLAALDVKPEFRGLGLGEALLQALLEALGPDDGRFLVVDLPCSFESFSRVLLREGLRPFETRYLVDLTRRRSFA